MKVASFDLNSDVPSVAEAIRIVPSLIYSAIRPETNVLAAPPMKMLRVVNAGHMLSNMTESRPYSVF